VGETTGPGSAANKEVQIFRAPSRTSCLHRGADPIALARSMKPPSPWAARDGSDHGLQGIDGELSTVGSG